MDDEQKRISGLLFDRMGKDIESGKAKQEAVARVKASGREWSAVDENQWKAALFCLGYPPDMDQPEAE